MTPAQMKELLDRGIPQAFAEGKTIQIRVINGQWADDSGLAFALEARECRIKPQPKARPFNVEEMRALLGKVITIDGDDLLIVGRNERGCIKVGDYWYSANELLENEYTIDGKRCEVVE